MEDGRPSSEDKSGQYRGIRWQGRRPEGKWLAELLGNERAVGPLLVYLKDTVVGSREGVIEKTDGSAAKK